MSLYAVRSSEREKPASVSHLIPLGPKGSKTAPELKKNVPGTRITPPVIALGSTDGCKLTVVVRNSGSSRYRTDRLPASYRSMRDRLTFPIHCLTISSKSSAVLRYWLGGCIAKSGSVFSGESSGMASRFIVPFGECQFCHGARNSFITGSPLRWHAKQA